MSKTICIDCDNLFSSDLFDGELKCEVTDEWFDLTSILFTGTTDGECEDFKEE